MTFVRVCVCVCECGCLETLRYWSLIHTWHVYTARIPYMVTFVRSLVPLFCLLFEKPILDFS